MTGTGEVDRRKGAGKGSDKRVAIVTGASSGIGEEAALEFLERGYLVHAVDRRTETMRNLELKGAQLHQVDPFDKEAIEELIRSILHKEGRVDVLVSNFK